MEDDRPVQGNDDSFREDISLNASNHGFDSSKNSVDSAYNPKAAPSREAVEQFTGYKHGGDSEYGPLPKFLPSSGLLLN